MEASKPARAEPSGDRARSATRVAVLIGLVYAVFGILWVLLSDRWVASLSDDLDWLAAAQRYKGLFYIVLTTAGLIYLIAIGYTRLLAERSRAQHSNLQLWELFSNHPQPMWAFDRESLRFLRVNDAALDLYGYAREEFLRMSATDILPAEDIAAFRAALAASPEALRGPTAVRYVRKSGESLVAHATGRPLEIDGQPAWMVMAEDITEEARTRVALEQQQEQFRQLHQSLGEVLWLATADGRRVLYVSPAFSTLYGRDPAEMVTDPDLWMKVIHPDDLAQAAQGDLFSAQDRTLTSRYRIVRPDGSIRWVEDRKRVICDADGRAVMIGGIGEDITARQERDEAQEQLRDELERRVAERTQELEQANVELEAFSRTAAHDLRTPLNGIVGFSELLSRRYGAQLDEEAQRFLDRIRLSARQMAQLINDLLAFSHAGHVQARCELTDLAPVAHAVVEELRGASGQRQVQVRLPERMPAWCDPGLMRSVLQNLIGNAWKFSAENPQASITVEVGMQDGMTRITVADNGVGFDTGADSGGFRPFQRFHPSAQFPGTGLGLVTCLRIAQRHGGQLVVESSPGTGTTAALLLPPAPQDPAQAPAQPLGVSSPTRD